MNTNAPILTDIVTRGTVPAINDVTLENVLDESNSNLAYEEVEQIVNKKLDQFKQELLNDLKTILKNNQ